MAHYIAIDFSDAKLAMGERFDADCTVNAAKEDVQSAVLGMTGSRDADDGFIGAGSAAAIERGGTLLWCSGTLMVVGMTASSVGVGFETVNIADQDWRILGSRMGSASAQGADAGRPLPERLFKLDAPISG